MRKRVRTWPVRVWKFRCYPDTGPSLIPTQPFWEEANKMKDFWNRLLDLSNQNRETYREILCQDHDYQLALSLYEAAAEKQEAAWVAIKTERQRYKTKDFPSAERLMVAYREADDERKAAAAVLKTATRAARSTLKYAIEILQEDWNETLRRERQTKVMNYGNREFVLDHFKTARARAMKEGAELHPQRHLTEMNFFHQFPGGLPWLAGEADTSDRVRPRPATRFSVGELEPSHTRNAPIYHWSFQVGATSIPMRVRYHRPIPPGALIKSITLHGREMQRSGVWQQRQGMYTPARGRWEWHVLLVLELDPDKQPALPERKPATCGIDIGWRRMDDGGLRVAVLTDEHGRSEELRLPDEMLRRWEHLQEIQTEISTKAEALTKELKALELPSDPTVREMITSMRFTSVPNLWRLYRAMEEFVTPHVLKLEAWAKEQTELERAHTGGFKRLCNWRTDVYRKWAASVCRRFTTIAIEDLDLKRMAEEKDKAPRLENSMEMRQLASTYSLTQILLHMAGKWQCEITKREPQYTSITCPVCGTIATENTGEIILLCAACGTAQDQDIRASQNIRHAPLAAANG